MQMAIKSLEYIDDEAAGALGNYFRFMAHYIVAASEYMRPDQVREITTIQWHLKLVFICNENSSRLPFHPPSSRRS
jgi:hypothetical protein